MESGDTETKEEQMRGERTAKKPVDGWIDRLEGCWLLSVDVVRLFVIVVSDVVVGYIVIFAPIDLDFRQLCSNNVFQRRYSVKREDKKMKIKNKSKENNRKKNKPSFLPTIIKLEMIAKKPFLFYRSDSFCL